MDLDDKINVRILELVDRAEESVGRLWYEWTDRWVFVQQVRFLAEDTGQKMPLLKRIYAVEAQLLKELHD